MPSFPAQSTTLTGCQLQILETRTEAPELLGALQTLSTFYGEDNSPNARRQLQDATVKRGLQVNQEFLAGASALLQVSWFALMQNAQDDSMSHATQHAAVHAVMHHASAISTCAAVVRS